MHALTRIADRLARDVGGLRFGPPVTHVYNPLVYARAPYHDYLTRFGDAPKEAVLLGMNPGPFGMAQTGAPFGDVESARDWLGITGVIGKPEAEHPKRPVEGFGCRRREVSGQRLWGWARTRFGTPDHFFARFFVANYCPLCFMEESGRNRTPDQLPANERQPLFDACDEALRQTIEALRPVWVLGVGKFAETRARHALEGYGVRVAGVLHPSPASPQANRGWEASMDRALDALGIRC